MIIDQTPLAGEAAYLRTEDSQINIQDGSVRVGHSNDVDEGVAHQVGSIALLIEGDDLLPLYAHQEKPLLTIGLTKEIFPGLYGDPYASRIHQIAGTEAFHRGDSAGMRIMDVNQVPTLVSVGSQDVSWNSALYRLPSSVELGDIAWDLAVSRRTPADAFRYAVHLEYWRAGEDLDVDGHDEEIVADRSASEPRFLQGVSLEGVVAYRLFFKAAVHQDSFLQEVLSGHPEREPLGIPLLQAFYLREPVASRFQFHSLLEMTAQASTYHCFETGDGRARRLVASLPFAATLLRGESIHLEVSSGFFKRIEARLNATVIVRSPQRHEGA